MDKSSRRFYTSDDWSSLVAVLVFSETYPYDLVGYIFIKDHSKEKPLKWKLAGGKKEKETTEEVKKDKNPTITAGRELEEETGIIVPYNEIRQIPKGNAWRSNHWTRLHAVWIPESQAKTIHSNHPRNEGEEPRFFTVDEFEQLKKDKEFMPLHMKKIKFVKSFFGLD